MDGMKARNTTGLNWDSARNIIINVYKGLIRKQKAQKYNIISVC